jgi:glutamate synthase (NADPH/NADH) small chain
MVIKKSNPFFKLAAPVLRLIQNLFKRKKSLIKAGTSWADVKLEINAEVNRYLEMRHVQADEVKQVIYHAETTGEKLYQPGANKYLGKLKIGRATFYVDYELGESSFIVRSAYAHRSEIIG